MHSKFGKGTNDGGNDAAWQGAAQAPVSGAGTGRGGYAAETGTHTVLGSEQSGAAGPANDRAPQGVGRTGGSMLDGSQQIQGGQQNGGAASNAEAPFSVKFPEELAVNQEMLENYKSFCTECGLNNQQAQQAVDFYMKEQARQMDAEKELSMNLLRSGAWKGQFDQKLAVANYAVQALDTQLGGRLVPMLEAGLGNNHVVAELMACVGDLLQEENFIPRSGGSVAARSMSTEDFLRKEVFNNR